MPERAVKTPGPDHPITVTPNPRRIVVKVAGTVIADTTRALTLQEADYPAVHYIPRGDVDMTKLDHSATHTYCPYKGEASYYDVTLGTARSADAAWTYETPHAAVPQIRDHLAFYASRVDSIEISDR